jgi:hypothetical protein
MSTATPTATQAAPSLGPTVVAVSAAFLGVNTFFIGLRCYTRAKIAKQFTYNDVIMLIALVSFRGVSSILFNLADGSRRFTRVYLLYLLSALRMV